MQSEEALVSKLRRFAEMQGGGGRGRSVGYAYEHLGLFPPSSLARKRKEFNLKLELLSLQLRHKDLEVSTEVISGIELLQYHPVIIALLKLANSSTATALPHTTTSVLEITQWWKGHLFRMVGNHHFSLPTPPPPPMLLLPPPPPPAITTTKLHAYEHELSTTNSCKPISKMARMLEQCSTQLAAVMHFPIRLQNTCQRHAEQLIAEQRLEIEIWLMEHYTKGGRMQLERFARGKIQDIEILVHLLLQCEAKTFCDLVDRLDVLCHEHCNAKLASVALQLFTRAKTACEFDVLHRFLIDYSAFALHLPKCLGGDQMAERCGKCKVLMLRYELKLTHDIASIEAYCERMESKASEICRTNLLRNVLPALEQALIFNIEREDGEEEEEENVGKEIRSTLVRIRECRCRFQLMCYERFHFFQAIEVFILNRLSWEFFPRLKREIASSKSDLWELEALIQDKLSSLAREPWNNVLLINLMRPANCLELERFREARNQFVRFLIQLESSTFHPTATMLLQSLDANGFHIKQANS